MSQQQSAQPYEAFVVSASELAAVYLKQRYPLLQQLEQLERLQTLEAWLTLGEAAQREGVEGVPPESEDSWDGTSEHLARITAWKLYAAAKKGERKEVESILDRLKADIGQMSQLEYDMTEYLPVLSEVVLGQHAHRHAPAIREQLQSELDRLKLDPANVKRYLHARQSLPAGLKGFLKRFLFDPLQAEEARRQVAEDNPPAEPEDRTSPADQEGHRPRQPIDTNTPPATTEPLPDTPSREFCMPRLKVIRWEREEEVQPRLWHLLGLMLDSSGSSVSYEEARQAMSGGTVKSKSDKSVRNDMSALNDHLGNISFPWFLSSEGGFIAFKK